MRHEVEIINDGQGVAILGDESAVAQFLAAAELPSVSLDRHLLTSVAETAGTVAQAGAEIAANSGRWVKLTAESADKLKVGQLMKGSQIGTVRAVVTDGAGKITSHLEILRTPATMLANPAMLAGVGGILAQVALQQSLKEITEYLKSIDVKVDDILRGQKNEVLSSVIGAGRVIDEAMTIRDKVGGVPDATWVGVAHTKSDLAAAQSRAVLEVQGIADKLETGTRFKATKEALQAAERSVQEWLVVLARCCQLQDQVAILELDRVLASEPGVWGRYREAILEARSQRRSEIDAAVSDLADRLNIAGKRAGAKVLASPWASKEAVSAQNLAAQSVNDFCSQLGFEEDGVTLSGPSWRKALSETTNSVLEQGAHGVDSAMAAGQSTLDQALSTGGHVVASVSRRLRVGLPRKADADEITE